MEKTASDEEKALKKGHKKALGLEDAEKGTPVSNTLAKYYEEHELLQDIPVSVIRKAWFTTSHLLLKPGARVADMGCDDGVMTYVMAVMNPHVHFIGIDWDRPKINKARKTYSRPNLEYYAGDLTKTLKFDDNSLNAIINSFLLHEIYSDSKYNDGPLIDLIKRQFALLKHDGLIFIHDHAMPPPGEYVQIEMPDAASPDNSVEKMSEADLLVWYSEHARPQEDESCHGFFIEELPPRFPGTRLFRLPYKWAYEFVLRKDDRQNWERELANEYTFFTPREFRKTLRNIGARVLYTAPFWDESTIRQKFEHRFRLYDDNGTSLGYPATSFVAVAQKKNERESLRLVERRPSQNMDYSLTVTAMRNESTNKTYDIVSRNIDLCEIIPYRLTEEGELFIYVHEGLPRGIVNAVPRSGKEIDGKRWSGHMTEAISLPTHIVEDADSGEIKDSVKLARDYLGLKPAMGCKLEKGPSYYPAPDLIDERVQTRYLRIAEHKTDIEPRYIQPDIDGFTTVGQISELSAQNILNAITVGFIPNSRLELQLLELYDRLDITPETWSESPLVLQDGTPENMLDMEKLKKLNHQPDERFKKVRGTTGNIRTIKSLFVDEGSVEGGITGVKSRDLDFVVSDKETINKAAVMPLTRHAISGDILAGVVTEYLPVPQRYKNNGLTLRVPTLTIPKEITTMEQARNYVADKFDVSPDLVARLGESYFTHVGVTPTRVFPFVVSTAKTKQSPMGGPVEYAPLQYIGELFGIVLDWDMDEELASNLRKAGRFIGGGSDITLNWQQRRRQSEDLKLKDNQPVIAHGLDMTGVGIGGSGRKKKEESAEDDMEPGKNKEHISTPDFIDVKNKDNLKELYAANWRKTLSKKKAPEWTDTLEKGTATRQKKPADGQKTGNKADNEKGGDT